MTAPRPSLPPAYFDALYAGDPDPWRFSTSEYERAKYAATLDALPRPGFRRAFEAGCSVGVLSRRLAPRCDALLAVDVAEAALAQARRRCADLPQVAFRRMEIPAEWPEGRFDLILLSEVLYYLSPDDIRRTAALVRASLDEGGAVLLVHWVLGTDYPCTGDDAASIFIDASGFKPVRQSRTREYRLDLLTSPPRPAT